MLENVKKLSQTRFQKTNFKAFSFFLIFSLLIWILVQFSKTYQEIIQVPVDLVQIPKDKIITEPPVYLDMKLKESGFEIAWFSLFKKKLKIDLSKLPVKGEQLVYDITDNSKNIRQQLGFTTEDVVFMKDAIKIDYQQKAIQTLPVVSDIKINYQPGYGSDDSMQLSPDSIKVSGPREALRSLEKLKTVSVELKEVNGPVSGTIAIDTMGFGKITLYRNTVEYALEVEKFTEGKMQVPIGIINAPENTEIVIFPKNLIVIFKVSLQNYKEVNKSDFRIVCDYNELEPGQNFFIPKVLKRPETITNLRLNINKVDFLVKK